MLPPYGKILKAYQDANVILPYPLTVFTGENAFKHTANLIRHEVCTFLPTEKTPEIYNWPVKNLRVIIIDTGLTNLTILELLTYCLLKKGRAKIVSIHSNRCPNDIEIIHP